MSIRRVFGCDGPECEKHVQTGAEQPPTFLTVIENPGYLHETGAEFHFCSWDCVLKHAATVPPTEIFDPSNDGGSP